jgi:hypothetical protein
MFLKLQNSAHSLLSRIRHPLFVLSDVTLAFFYKKSTLFRRASFDGYDRKLAAECQIDSWSDRDLKKLNGIIEWRCFSVDKIGRRFGHKAWKNRRQVPEPIPSSEVTLFSQFCDLKGALVLDVGCFEGIHSISLSLMGAKVVAVDARVENVVKTIIRSGIYRTPVETIKFAFEKDSVDTLPKNIDYVFHRSVLPLMEDPVKHLHDLGKIAKTGIYLDTVIYSKLHETYQTMGQTFPCLTMPNLRTNGEFSGVAKIGRGLEEGTIVNALKTVGFKKILHYNLWNNLFGKGLRIIAVK